MGFDLGNVAHIRDINLNAFKEAVLSGGSADDFTATVKVNSNTFSVRVLNGEMNVAFSSGNAFTNYFRKDTLQRARQQLQTAYREAVARTQYGTPVEKLNQLFAKGNAEVAHYGFSDDVRTPFLTSYRKINPTNADKNVMIDGYNTHVGIEWDKMLFAMFGQLVDKIRNKSLTVKNPNARYTPEKLDRWIKYLSENVGKLDIFSRIAADIAESKVPGGKSTGWAGEYRAKGVDGGLRELVMKNLVVIEKRGMKFGNAEVKLFAGILKKLSEMDTTGMTAAQADLARDKILQAELNRFCPRRANRTKNNTLYEAFQNMVINMFFRQTSKLGLKFFQKEGVPVLFQWRDRTGKDIATQDYNDKWWKNANADITKHHWDPITFSEMRQVERMVQNGEGDGIHRVRNPVGTDGSCSD